MREVSALGVAARVPSTNRLLDRLSRKARTRVLSRCDEVELSFGEVLAEPGGPLRNVYFPTGSFISRLVAMGGSGILEVSLAGNEGFHGVPLALGVGVSSGRAVVQGSGPALQMGATAFRRELAQCPELRDCIHRYIYVLMAQFLRTAGCNHFHLVEQRVARWLLMTADRTQSADFRITHEFLAHMLAVRRVGITKAAGALQERGLIGYTRGAVTILDRKGLERASCSCYRYDLAIYDSMFA